MMHTDGAVSASIGPLAGGLFASFANLAEDGTLCFVSDKLHRACPACGTVFTGSAWRAATTELGTVPVLRLGRDQADGRPLRGVNTGASARKEEDWDASSGIAQAHHGRSGHFGGHAQP